VTTSTIARPPVEMRLGVRVYYEDTDAGGVVYYASYLRFVERARTELLRTLGVDQSALARETGLVFAVRSLRAEYLRSGRLDDELTVVTTVRAVSGAQITVQQHVDRGDERLFTADVRIVCVDARRMKPTAIPQRIRDGFAALARP